MHHARLLPSSPLKLLIVCMLSISARNILLMNPKVSYEYSSFQQHYQIFINQSKSSQAYIRFIYLQSNYSFSLPNVEPEEDDVSVLHHVLFSLLHVLSLGLAGVFAAQSHQVVVLHDFRADEALFEIGVDDSCGLRGFRKLSDGPAPHLVGSRGEIVDQIEGVVAGLDDLGDHGPLLVVLAVQFGALVLSTVGNDLSRHVGIDEVLDLFEPLVLLALEVGLAEIDQVDNRFGSDEAMGVEECDISIGPLSMPDPFVLLQDVLSLHQHLLLLSCFLRVGPLYKLLQVFQPVGDVLEILEDQLSVDDLHIPDGVD